MDTSKFKSTTTSRGFTYAYYFSPAQQAKLTLLFCHGFPSMAKDWEKVAIPLAEEGYGVIVPDMLGYGGTSKPLDPAAYVGSGLAQDAVNILDAENIQKAVVIGHDWGSKVASRVANYYPERFVAYAYFAAPYVGLQPPGITYEQVLAISKANFGYELFGYWPYFGGQELDGDFRAHPESFFHLLFPNDPEVWRNQLAPSGAIQPAVRSEFRAPLPSWLTEKDKQEFIENFKKNGLAAPGRWYEVMTSGLQNLDDRNAPESTKFPPVSAPIFFGAALKDYICVAAAGKSLFASDPFENHNVTICDFDGDHWIIISHADEITKDLKQWLKLVVEKKANL